MTVPGEVKLARHAGDLDDDGHDTHAVSRYTSVIGGKVVNATSQSGV